MPYMNTPPYASWIFSRRWTDLLVSYRDFLADQLARIIAVPAHLLQHWLILGARIAPGSGRRAALPEDQVFKTPCGTGVHIASEQVPIIGIWWGDVR